MYFNSLEAVPKENRRASILDITSADAETAGTSQAVPNINNESMLPRESSNNTEQTISVSGGDSSGHNPFVSDKFIFNSSFSADDIIMEQEDPNDTRLHVDVARSLLPSERPCNGTSSGTYTYPIARIGSDLEALITEHMDEDNDINFIFDVGKAPTSHAMLFNANHNRISCITISSFGAQDRASTIGYVIFNCLMES
ncbi:hypothetical protein CQW23_22039 [Capsicum baccatum]|uniref:Uncharacterized protein n=1 Tax=Capsicum baccatum TaxID=33114 RepID=A0A2G2VZR1_CAPBA|nr:hypothetical protein CQW23_22039 [Capsicum baccatum]